MTSFIVRGSMNNAEFGPATLDIDDELWVTGETDAEAQAVLDALLQAEGVEGVELAVQHIVQAENGGGESAQTRAIHYGFTAFEYRRPDGKNIKIV